jgi:hypothetical protein
MKKSITRNLACLTFMVLSIWTMQVMAQSQEQIEKFKQEREAYYTEHLELTPEESKAFWPVYDDFHNRKMKIVEEERNNFSYAHSNSDNLTDTEITEILKKVSQLKKEQLDLEVEYYQDKFLNVLPPKKVLKLYKVEWDFRRHLLRKLRGSHRGERGGKDQGDRSGRGPGGMAPPPELIF